MKTISVRTFFLLGAGLFTAACAHPQEVVMITAAETPPSKIQVSTFYDNSRVIFAVPEGTLECQGDRAEKVMTTYGAEACACIAKSTSIDVFPENPKKGTTTVSCTQIPKSIGPP